VFENLQSFTPTTSGNQRVTTKAKSMSTAYCDPAGGPQIHKLQFENPTPTPTKRVLEESFSKIVNRSDALNGHLINTTSLLVMTLPLVIIALFVLFRWPHLCIAHSMRPYKYKYTPPPRARVKVIASATNVMNVTNESALNVDIYNGDAASPPSDEAKVTITKDETESETESEPETETEPELSDVEEEVTTSRVKRRRGRRQRYNKIQRNNEHDPEPEFQAEPEPECQPEPEPESETELESEPIKPIKRRKRKLRNTATADLKNKRMEKKKSRSLNNKVNEAAEATEGFRKVKKQRRKAKPTKAPMNAYAITMGKHKKKKKEKKEYRSVVAKSPSPSHSPSVPSEDSVLSLPAQPNEPKPKPKPVSQYIANVFEAFYFENEPSPDFAECDNSDSKTSPTQTPTTSQQQRTHAAVDAESVVDVGDLDWELGLQRDEHTTNVGAIDLHADLDIDDELPPNRPHFKPGVYSHSGGDLSSTPFAIEQRPSSSAELFKHYGSEAPPRILAVRGSQRSPSNFHGVGETPPNFDAMSMCDILKISPPLTLREIIDCNLVYRFVRDQGGSRRVQSVLDAMSAEERTVAVSMLVAHLIGVNANLLFVAECVYANYLMQMFFGCGTERDRDALCHNFLFASTLRLCENKYGCRVVQKAMSVVRMEHKLEIVQCLRDQLILEGRGVGAVLLDQHANHVLQVVLEQELPFSSVEFLRDGLESDLAQFSEHLYACRVVQAMIKAYGDELEVALLLTDDGGHLALAKSKYGNYVIQCIIAQKVWYSNLQRIYNFRMRIIRDVLVPKNLWELSRDKFGSNVSELCIAAASEDQLTRLVEYMADPKNEEGAALLRKMAVQQFANYVIKTIIEHCNDAMKRKMVLAVHRNVANLHNYNEYGGHGQYGYGDELLVKCKQMMLSFKRGPPRRRGRQ